MRNTRRYALAALAGALAIAALGAGFAIWGGADDGSLLPEETYGENMPDPAGGVYIINEMYGIGRGRGGAAVGPDNSGGGRKAAGTVLDYPRPPALESQPSGS